MTNKQEVYHRNTNECHICHREIKSDKVKDHDHITGDYIGPAHTSCNINRNYKNFQIPIGIHNSGGYDTHLIIKELPNILSSLKMKNMISTKQLQ